MALNIPNVGSPSEALLGGINTGSSMFSRLMQPILERERQAQLEKHFQQKAALQRAKDAQLERHFQQELGLRKAAAGRNAELFNYRLQALKDKHAQSEFEKSIRDRVMQGAFGAQSGARNTSYPALNKLFSGQGALQEGQVSSPNIDLGTRPLVKNPETGGESSVYSMSIGTPEGEALIPRVSDDGRVLSEKEAIEQFQKTGKHLGIYSSPDEATNAAQLIHKQQESQFGLDNKQSINGIPLEYLMQAITAKSLGLPVPKMGGESAYQGVAREAADLERLKKEVGENSPVYQGARKAYEAKLHAQEDLSGIRGRTLGGLKTGERWLVDNETGQPIGKEIPLTATERDEYRGRGFFNYAFPYISKGLSPISGKGSYSKISNAASQYGRNPEATKLIDDFLLGKKLLTAGMVKESSTLGSGKQKVTYQQLRESLDSSDIPKTMVSIIKQFGLPAEAAMKADRRFQEILNAGTKAGEKAVPAFQKQYFEPDKYQEDNKSLIDNKKSMDDSLVIVIDPNGKKFETTEENAAHLPEGWRRG